MRRLWFTDEKRNIIMHYYYYYYFEGDRYIVFVNLELDPETVGQHLYQEAIEICSVIIGNNACSNILSVRNHEKRTQRHSFPLNIHHNESEILIEPQIGAHILELYFKYIILFSNYGLIFCNYYFDNIDIQKYFISNSLVKYLNNISLLPGEIMSR